MKKNFIVRIICLTFSLLLFSLPVCGEKDYDIDKCINDILILKKQSNNSSENGYIINTNMMSNIFSREDSEFIIAMSQYGIEDNYDLYGKVLLEYLKDKYSQTQKLSDLNTASGAQIALTLLACDYNPLYIEDKSGKVYNFLADTIYQRDSAFSLGKDGIEAYARGIIAIDSYDFGITDDVWKIRDELISQIVQNQNDDGTFSNSSDLSPYYLTALTLTAIAKYYHNTQRKEAEIQERIEERNEKDKKRLEEGKKATFEEFEKQYESEQEPLLYDMLDETIDKAIEALSNAQDENGSFKCAKKDNIRVTSMMITALCSMGIDPQNEENFIKNGNNLIDGLMKMKNSDGSFLSEKGGNKDSDTVQAFSALVSYSRLKSGKSPLYDFSEKTLSLKNDMLFISNQDIENLKNIGKNLTLDDYPYIYILRNKLSQHNTKKANYYISYIDCLSERLLKQKQTIDYINSRGNEIIYSVKGINLAMQRELNSLIELCESLPENNKEKIVIYDDLKETAKKLDTTITVDTLMLASGIVIVMSFVLTLLLVYIKKRALKNITLESITNFHNHSLKRARISKENDLKLPFEENEEFFNYNIEEEINETQENSKALPFETAEDFFEYDSEFTEETIEEDDSFNLPFEEDDGFFVYDYDENEEKKH